MGERLHDICNVKKEMLCDKVSASDGCSSFTIQSPDELAPSRCVTNNASLYDNQSMVGEGAIGDLLQPTSSMRQHARLDRIAALSSSSMKHVTFDGCEHLRVCTSCRALLCILHES